MISVQEAISILAQNMPMPQTQRFPLIEARNHILAASILSPINMPPFRQSAMDGYALCLHQSLSYEIIGEIKAGDSQKLHLLPGQAVKIFTGAAVPDSAQAVIQIEKVSSIGTQLQLEAFPEPQMNIRPIGEQIAKGALALEKGSLLNAASIGYLAGLGLTEVPIYQKPKVAIVVTGNELCKPGQTLEYGKVYESNGIMLQSALFDAQYTQISLYEVKDNLEDTIYILNKAICEHEIVLISGGISVGDYDFVARALESLEVKTLFHKVNQKPGKPLYTGTRDNKLIFALPGNPAACLSCFYVYVLPSLAILSGQKTDFLQTKKIPLAHDYNVKNSRAQFLKASIKEGAAEILSHQNSSMLNSFSLANALVYVAEGTYPIPQGETVSVYYL